MKIGVVSKAEGGVCYHRLIKPFSLMDYDITRCEGVSEEMFDYNFDVVVFNRILPVMKQKEFIKELQKRGTYVICDVDDHWILDRSHVAKKAGDYFKKQSIEALTYSDEVWCTHDMLAGHVANLNSNWHVIPNALDPTEPQWKSKTKYGNRIGWAGGITHFNDLMLTKDAFKDITPVICGFRNEPEWIKLADNFKADYLGALGVEEYGLLYDQFDIAIAPLVDNRFNRCKSNLKILEAGIKGLPIFVQNIHPYTDDAKGIFKVDDWTASMQEAQNMEPEAVKEYGQELRQYVLDNYDLRKVNELRKDRLE